MKNVADYYREQIAAEKKLSEAKDIIKEMTQRAIVVEDRLGWEWEALIRRSSRVVY